MFDIEISRTWYLFSGPVYVSVSVAVYVTMIWCIRRCVCNYDLKNKPVESSQEQNGTRLMA